MLMKAYTVLERCGREVVFSETSVTAKAWTADKEVILIYPNAVVYTRVHVSER